MPLRPEDDQGHSVHTRIREYLGERLYTLAEKTNYPLNERFVLPCVLQALNRTGIDVQADLAGGYFCASPVTLHIDDITVHIRGSGVLTMDDMLGNGETMTVRSLHEGARIAIGRTYRNAREQLDPDTGNRMSIRKLFQAMQSGRSKRFRNYLREDLTSLMAAYQEAVFLPRESGEVHEPRILHDVMPLDWNPQVYERSLTEVPEYMSWGQAVERAQEYPSWSESVPDQDSLREILWRTYLARFVWKMKYPLRPKYHRKAGRNYRAIQRILLESGDHCLRKVH